MNLDRLRNFTADRFPLAALGVLTFLFAFYQLVFLHVRPYDIDNPWFLSFSYGRTIGEAHDTFMGLPIPAGMDGTWFFGKIPAIIQAAWLRHFDWQARPAAILVSTLVVLGLAMLVATLRRLKFPPLLILGFTLALGLSEPLVLTANRFRYESVALLFILAGLWAASCGYAPIAAFFAVLAVESEPAALLGLAPVLTLLYVQRRRSLTVTALLAFLGGTCAFLAGLALHPDWLHPPAALSGAKGSHLLGAALDYFVLPRHLPETVALLALAILLITGRLRIRYQQPWLLSALAATLVLNAALPHGNPSYATFLFPTLLLIAFAAMPSDRAILLATVFIGGFYTSQDALLAWQNRHTGYSQADILAVRHFLNQGAQSIGMDPASATVHGDFRLWFAHPRQYHSNGGQTQKYFATDDLVLCFPVTPRSTPLVVNMLTCGDFQHLMPNLRLIATMQLHNQALNLYTTHPASNL